jgi:hypothetical protein
MWFAWFKMLRRDLIWLGGERCGFSLAHAAAPVVEQYTWHCDGRAGARAERTRTADTAARRPRAQHQRVAFMLGPRAIREATTNVQRVVENLFRVESAQVNEHAHTPRLCEYAHHPQCRVSACVSVYS